MTVEGKQALERLKNQYGAVGCREKDIQELENALKVKLPATYREFLTIAGIDAGKPLKGTDCTYDLIIPLQEWAKELLAEADIQMPEHMFVFSMHQGYEFLAFDLTSGDDPSVFQFVEGDKELKSQWGSFSLYLADVIK